MNLAKRTMLLLIVALLLALPCAAQSKAISHNKARRQSKARRVRTLRTLHAQTKTLEQPESTPIQLMSNSPNGIQAGDSIAVSGTGLVRWSSSAWVTCITAEYKPQEDITTFELAKLLPWLTGSRGCFTEENWKQLGTANRHLIRMK